MQPPNEETDSPRNFKRKSRYMELKGYYFTRCIACNGSGYYDNCIRGKVPKCSSCNGTGMAWERKYK